MTYRLPAFALHVGVEILHTALDRVVGRILVGPQHSNGLDRVHGGAIMTLADTLGAIGSVLNLPPNAVTTTLESKTNFLAAGRGPELIGESIPLHISRNTMVWQTTIRDTEHRRVAVVTQTQLVLTLERPVKPMFNPSLVETAAHEKEVEITTFGRKTGTPSRRIVWITALDGRIYIRSGLGLTRDWPKNLLANGRAVLHIAGHDVAVRRPTRDRCGRGSLDARARQTQIRRRAPGPPAATSRSPRPSKPCSSLLPETPQA